MKKKAVKKRKAIIKKVVKKKKPVRHNNPGNIKRITLNTKIRCGSYQP